jgi:hypothetical protein
MQRKIDGEEWARLKFLNKGAQEEMRVVCPGSGGGNRECRSGDTEGVDESGCGYLGTAVGIGGFGRWTMAGAGAAVGGRIDDAGAAIQSNRVAVDGYCHDLSIQ